MTSRNYYAPVRPPRGTKVSKDTSGRLMNIIAELSVSKSNDDRQRKMQELKKDFELSDTRLVQLISDNRDHLSITMEAFSKISAKINTSRRGCRDVKEKLSACKKLLECKRDEIRRLWSESVEHREVITMLKEIEDLSKVREKVEEFLKEEKFDEATDVLVSSISLLEGRLAGVDALKDLKAELNTLRETLHQVLVQELHKHLYMLPEDAFLKRKIENENKNKSYEGLICPDADDRHIFSVTWARDKDISRLLRSLPNWTNLQIEDNSEEKAHEFEESPEEIRFRNKEESELLIRNLSCKDSISTCEIISDHNKLKNLALMHESMEWFSTQILIFAESLPDVQASLPSLIPEKFTDENDDSNEIKVGLTIKACLKKLAKEFENLADTCLLVLHLEVRAHCFYYLLPLSRQGSYVNRKDDQEPEPEVVRLNSDLSKIDEALSPILQPKKLKYVFEGLGELLSTILINSVSNIKKINENGVKKMGRNIFAIQQNLAGITMTREVALDRARQYFDLLNRSFEDILNQIVEEGPQFQEQEYAAIIQLLHNSREGLYEQDSLNNYREKLRQILDEVAVSV